MKSSWKSKLHELVTSGGRYAFEDINGNIPNVAHSGMFGDDHSMGFIDHISSLVNDFRKEAFDEGYVRGVQDALVDTKSDLVFDRDISKIGSGRAFINWEKEE